MRDFLLDKLNKQQKEAVLDNSIVCMVNANVGSGKTTVLTSKVLYLIKEQKIPIEDIIVLTFTNKAANEIKDRVKLLSNDFTDEKMKYFGTFHSVAMKILKESSKLENFGFNKDFTIIDPDEEADLAKEIIEEKGLTIKYQSKLIKRLEKFNYGIEHYGIMKENDDIAILVKLLNERKTFENKMNFDDLIRYATLLSNDEKKKPKWIVIDEFQDCDEHQLQFIKSLSNKDTHIFVVGDPNQVIYSWRGSSNNIFKDFKEQYQAKELSLPINYRSCASILDVAKVFLDGESNLEGVRDSGNKIIVKNHYNAFQEAEYLVNEIKRKTNENILSFRDIAIFYRMQKQSNVLEEVFAKAGIPYEVSLRKTVNDIPAIKWFIKLLKFSINNKDIISFYGVFCDNNFGPHLSKIEAKLIINEKKDNELLKKCFAFNDCFKKEEISHIYDYYTIDKLLYPSSANFLQNKELIHKFINEIIKFGNENKLVGREIILNFLNSSCLYGINLLNENINLSANSVKLMTLHSSKGMEFKQVYIIGANQGYIPMMCKDVKEEEEEKRLFFVGITRAKDNLEISYYASSESNNILSGPSRYLTMIPKNLISMECDFGEKQSNIFDLKRQIQTNISFIESKKERYSHEKYGVGEFIKEDELTITVIFDGYGEKTFLKAFNEVKKV